MEEILTKLAAKAAETTNLLTVSLVLARTMPMVFAAPFMGGSLTPTTVKMSIGVLFATLLYPLVRAGAVDIPLDPLTYFVLFLKEAFVGFVIGFIAMELWAAMDMSGRLVDTVRGASMAEVMVPTLRSRTTPIGDMYSQFLLVLFFAVGGHRVFILAYVSSYELIPINAVPDFGDGMWPFMELVIRWSAEILTIAFILAAPMIVATFLTDLVFGILNRVAPQLNAYFMAMPIKSMAAIGLVLVSWNLFVVELEGYIEQMLHHVQEAVYLLAATVV